MCQFLPLANIRDPQGCYIEHNKGGARGHHQESTDFRTSLVSNDFPFLEYDNADQALFGKIEMAAAANERGISHILKHLFREENFCILKFKKIKPTSDLSDIHQCLCVN